MKKIGLTLFIAVSSYTAIYAKGGRIGNGIVSPLSGGGMEKLYEEKIGNGIISKKQISSLLDGFERGIGKNGDREGHVISAVESGGVGRN